MLPFGIRFLYIRLFIWDYMTIWHMILFRPDNLVEALSDMWQWNSVGSFSFGCRIRRKGGKAGDDSQMEEEWFDDLGRFNSDLMECGQLRLDSTLVALKPSQYKHIITSSVVEACTVKSDVSKFLWSKASMHSQKYFATLLEAVHQFGMCQLKLFKSPKGTVLGTHASCDWSGGDHRTGVLKPSTDAEWVS